MLSRGKRIGNILASSMSVSTKHAGMSCEGILVEVWLMFWLLLLRSALSLVTVVERKLLPWVVPML